MAHEVEEFVFETLCEFGLERTEVTRQSHLDTLDIDSLHILELVQMVNERYRIRLEMEDFLGISTVGETIELIVSSEARS